MNYYADGGDEEYDKDAENDDKYKYKRKHSDEKDLMDFSDT